MIWTVRWRHPDGDYRTIGYYTHKNAHNEITDIARHWQARREQARYVEAYEIVRPKDEENTSASVAFDRILVDRDGMIYYGPTGTIDVNGIRLPELGEPEDWS